jgi:hypothetical protein
MGRYANTTEVPVEKSKAEIEETLRRYGASEFSSGWKTDSAMIVFRIRDLFIRFVLPFPSKDEKRFTHKKVGSFLKPMSDLQKMRAYEQELRSRWRALLLVIKAKLEACECKISSIESEFLAHIVMPNDVTIGEWMIDGALPAIRSGQMPRAIEGPKPKTTDEAIDAEFEVKGPQ